MSCTFTHTTPTAHAWIQAHPNPLHTEIPINVARELLQHVQQNRRYPAEAIFGYYVANGPDATVQLMADKALFAQYVEELEVKLELRLDKVGIPGVPLFYVSGVEFEVLPGFQAWLEAVGE